MEITVTVRHFDLSNEVRNYASDSISAAFADFRVKIRSVNLVLDMQRNLVTASLSAAVKDFPVSATSAAFDNVYKAVDEAVERAATQIRKYLDKRQDHGKAPGLKDVELEKQAEKE